MGFEPFSRLEFAKELIGKIVKNLYKNTLIRQSNIESHIILHQAEVAHFTPNICWLI